jgi:carboxypeptidase C (cathepsin A)
MKLQLSARALALAAAIVCITCIAPAVAKAQEPAKDAKAADAKAGAPPAAPADANAPKEESFSSDHTLTIGGGAIPYKAVASYTLLKDDKGEPTALMFSTAYTRSDSKGGSTRPIAFIYNGGPGSSSVWLHMGAFGPRRIVTANAAPTGPAPYQVVDNVSSLLDKTDMVFIDPVGTGFSHSVGKAQDKDFWGVDQDVHSLAQFINIYLNRNGRWNSPKFLIGESYGTFRSAALGNYLQQHDGIYINGIVLISSVLNTETISFNAGDDLSYMLYVPSYAAAAAYHKALNPAPSDLQAFLTEARKFAEGEYAVALNKGSNLTPQEKTDIATKLSHFIGLSPDYIEKADLRVNLAQFSVELERTQRLQTGRYDSRYQMPIFDMLTEFAEDDPSYTAVRGAFTAGFNSYIRDDLKVPFERRYEILSGGPGGSWDWKHGQNGGFPSSPSVAGDLIQAIETNGNLHVQVENGYYDMATPFFATEYTMDHLFMPANLRNNIEFEYYGAGHMMYLSPDDLPKLKSNIGTFIDKYAKQ